MRRADTSRQQRAGADWRGMVAVGMCALVVGCARGGGAAATPSVFAVQSDNRAILSVVRQALAWDAAGRRADSLYARPVTVIANGSQRAGAPRFAGIGVGGRVMISDLSGEVSLPFAWAQVSYRWSSGDGSALEAGRATFILENTLGRWRIKHAHSSVVPPWERSPGGWAEE